MRNVEPATRCDRQAQFAVIDRMREAFANVSTEEIEREVATAVAEVLAEMEADRTGSNPSSPAHTDSGSMVDSAHIAWRQSLECTPFSGPGAKGGLAPPDGRLARRGGQRWPGDGPLVASLSSS